MEQGLLARVHVLVDPSVTSIPDDAFYQRTKLTKVELCKGLAEIGFIPLLVAFIQLQ